MVPKIVMQHYAAEASRNPLVKGEGIVCLMLRLLLRTSGKVAVPINLVLHFVQLAGLTRDAARGMARQALFSHTHFHHGLKGKSMASTLTAEERTKLIEGAFEGTLLSTNARFIPSSYRTFSSQEIFI